MDLWNIRNQAKPPVTTLPCPVTLKSTDKLNEIRNKLQEARKVLTNKYDNSWHTERFLLERLVYKLRNQMGRYKWYQSCTQLRQCIRRLDNVDIKELLNSLVEGIPSKWLVGQDSVYLPTQAITDYARVRMQGAALLLRRASSLCISTYRIVGGEMRLGMQVDKMLTLSALLSRLWVLCESLSVYICQWYKLAVRLSHLLPASVKPWLPKGLVLPQTLQPWLDRSLPALHKPGFPLPSTSKQTMPYMMAGDSSLVATDEITADEEGEDSEFGKQHDLSLSEIYPSHDQDNSVNSTVKCTSVEDMGEVVERPVRKQLVSSDVCSMAGQSATSNMADHPSSSKREIDSGVKTHYTSEKEVAMQSNEQRESKTRLKREKKDKLDGLPSPLPQKVKKKLAAYRKRMGHVQSIAELSEFLMWLKREEGIEESAGLLSLLETRQKKSSILKNECKRKAVLMKCIQDIIYWLEKTLCDKHYPNTTKTDFTENYRSPPEKPDKCSEDFWLEVMKKGKTFDRLHSISVAFKSTFHIPSEFQSDFLVMETRLVKWKEKNMEQRLMKKHKLLMMDLKKLLLRILNHQPKKRKHTKQ